ncbi:MAG: hypothetical protein ACI9MX_003937, partial [Candidatus Aldehydirespiratoraceae bacterium]
MLRRCPPFIAPLVAFAVATALLTAAPGVSAQEATPSRVIATIDASRTECVSPCTVVFSAEDTIDVDDTSLRHSFHDLGYHFDFDDLGSGVFATTGLSRARQIGAPLASHTFVCGNDATCTYEVGVRAQRDDGEFDDAFVTITVHDPDAAFGPANTICVSTSNTFGGAMPCPVGAARRTSTPPIEDLNNVRVLFRRGETFAAVCIDYGAADVLIESFGEPAVIAPHLVGISEVGVAGRCGDTIPDDSQIGAIDGSSGYPRLWAHSITLNGLRPEHVAVGMSYTHVELHDLEMDFEDDAAGGAIGLARNTSACQNSSNLTCDRVPYPVGVYLSDSTIARSVSEIQTNGAMFGGVNVGSFNCPIINWATVIGSTIWSSNEHNIRTEGTWRVVHAHNDIDGHHYRDDPNNGVRQKVTVRACGSGEMDPAELIYRHSGADSTPQSPMTRFAVIADNELGSEDDFGFGAKITTAPTNGASAEVISYAIIERNVFTQPAVAYLSTNDAILDGFHLACRDNDHSTPGPVQDCVEGSQDSIPDEWHNPSVLSAATPPQPGAPERGAISAPVACPVAPHPFTDVGTTSFANDDISCIFGLGITTGTGPSTYNPNGNVTREQMAAFIARLWRT